MKYLGNKNSQRELIVSKIKQNCPNNQFIGDLFSGTGAVTMQLKRNGYRIHANDYLRQCEIRARVILLLSGAPSFTGLDDEFSSEDDRRILTDSAYHRALNHLNGLDGKEGFFFREYCPDGSRLHAQWERRYFTKKNAMKIDAIRAKIVEWKEEKVITDLEHSLLLVNLIEAINKVANISGTYGCFLKEFESNALDTLCLTPFHFVPGECNHWVTRMDVFEAAKRTPSEVVYLDPPFTKRQYATYYHIPETIAMEAEPRVEGKTGIGPWRDKCSDFCYKRRALDGLRRLLDLLWPREIFLSYSSDGHIGKSEILELMSEFGTVEVFDYEQKRFKSGIRETKDSILHEFLFRLSEGGS